ncbi:PREDICTED: UDP-glycosyltransferase 82A1 [Nicotiana attenuata]|uniref:Glycosyltransferase n=1 Tax=Nicotiana attenuata TaxID=49451 RepID=A0A1J6J338_NICAT|nr:PREDICTED: UDP-glycosyltransferase 82A1 [Nicotiana attenuata]AQQ16697.1 UDP-glycosyltransferase g30507 [Nicotiana attenuata]OIT01705.1 udp-glycosyltransferase 82a1 [Nicotiana attenuata]
MKCRKKTKVLLVPYPAQGHVTPMLKLASLLLNHGLNPIIITPNFIQINPKEDGISIISIPDGIEDGTPRDFFAIENAMENYMPYYFEKLVQEYEFDGKEEDGIVCVIVDLLASWAVKVANKFGIHVAGFWPAMFATYRLIDSIPDMLKNGIISETGCPLQNGPISISLGEPTLGLEDLPWLIGNSAASFSRFKFWTKTMERSRTLKWLLVNTFPDECHKVRNTTILNTKIDQSQDCPKILPIGPLNTHVTIKNASFWKEDSSCLDWLDMQTTNSVVYISFGSWVSPIGEAKVNSLALALVALKKPFIWVLAPLWREGLEKGYLEKISKQGKIVSWAPQIDVLQHEAVGCYLTHCGWNSTMEAIQSKKRLLCYPIAGDQFINCGYIVKKWRVGVRINDFEVKDLEEGLKRVMEDDEMSERIAILNEMTMGKVASSKAMANLTTFISNVRI